MEGITEVECWAEELESVFPRAAGRFGRADLRWRMRDYVGGLLAPVGRKNGWQLAEYAGHRDPAGLQHLLNGARWDADAVRDGLREYVGQQLGPDGVLIIDDTGFIKKGTTSAGVSRQYTGTSGKIDNCQIGVFAAYSSHRAWQNPRRSRALPAQVLDQGSRAVPGSEDPRTSAPFLPGESWPGAWSAAASPRVCPPPG
ncbi:transposase [Streptomyces sp. NPDC048751]|uniref:IS701 family transposase n=1 Tax=Streptomyces sp. NPDC048751 TaxID=3365591 RepID=UPI0037195B76